MSGSIRQIRGAMSKEILRVPEAWLLNTIWSSVAIDFDGDYVFIVPVIRSFLVQLTASYEDARSVVGPCFGV